MDNSEWCYECAGYGGNYYIDDNGDLVLFCPECPFNPVNQEEGGE